MLVKEFPICIGFTKCLKILWDVKILKVAKNNPTYLYISFTGKNTKHYPIVQCWIFLPILQMKRQTKILLNELEIQHFWETKSILQVSNTKIISLLNLTESFTQLWSTVIPFYRGLERLNDLPKVTELVSGGIRS